MTYKEDLFNTICEGVNCYDYEAVKNAIRVAKSEGLTDAKLNQSMDTLIDELRRIQVILFNRKNEGE
jgi:hypothetical protein